MRTKACTRCRRVFPRNQFRRSLTGWTGRLCPECVAIPPTHKGQRPPLRAAPPVAAPARTAPVIGSTEGLQPRERARHEMRVLAATLVARMMD